MIYSVERGVALGPVVFVGRLGPKSDSNLGAVQVEYDPQADYTFGRVATVDHDEDRVSITPFSDRYEAPNAFGGHEQISGAKINSSFLRGRIRWDQSINAEGSLIILGFKLPVKVPTRVQVLPEPVRP